MNRREAIGGMLATAMLPFWARKTPTVVPLHEFCGVGKSFRFDMATPFVQGDGSKLATYATDAKVCIRVASTDSDCGGLLGNRPPANRLGWDHDKTGGWKPWPKERPLLATESWCPRCNGYGTHNAKEAPECRTCDGFGCQRCNMRGSIGRDCPACKGDGNGIYPGIQEVGPAIIDASYDRKIRTHLRDVEYVVVDNGSPSWDKNDRLNVVLFRFDGGRGMLMSLAESSRKRIVGAS